MTLPDNALDAVLAHERSHTGNRDAALMTVLAAPGGIARLWATHPRLETRIEEIERLERRPQA